MFCVQAAGAGSHAASLADGGTPHLAHVRVTFPGSPARRKGQQAAASEGASPFRSGSGEGGVSLPSPRTPSVSHRGSIGSTPPQSGGSLLRAPPAAELAPACLSAFNVSAGILSERGAALWSAITAPIRRAAHGRPEAVGCGDEHGRLRQESSIYSGVDCGRETGTGATVRLLDDDDTAFAWRGAGGAAPARSVAAASGVYSHPDAGRQRHGARSQRSLLPELDLAAGVPAASAVASQGAPQQPLLRTPPPAPVTPAEDERSCVLPPRGVPSVAEMRGIWAEAGGGDFDECAAGTLIVDAFESAGGTSSPGPQGELETRLHPLRPQRDMLCVVCCEATRVRLSPVVVLPNMRAADLLNAAAAEKDATLLL